MTDKKKEVVRSYEGEFGSFEIDIYNGEILRDNIDRDKIWEVALTRAQQYDIDVYEEQRCMYLKLFDQIFTEDLIEYNIEWDWFFATYGAQFEVKTPEKEYTLIVDAEGSIIFS